MISISDFQDSTLRGLDLSKFSGKSICILGGTGFIGTWLVSTLNHLNLTQDVRVDISIFTRDEKRARARFPRESFNNLKIFEFDFSIGVCDLGIYDFFVNGATPTSTKPGAQSKDIFFLPTINAITSVIDSAKKYQNNPRVLNLSSGTVYGDQSMDLMLRPEGEAKVLKSSDDDYRASKIVCEDLLNDSDVRQILRATSPRLFTFYGPGLPINQHFAIGNFMRDGLSGTPIRINGNPKTRRSYMFPTDLVNWLLKSMLDPRTENLNIGSEFGISMLDLATLVSSVTSQKGVVLLNPTIPANNYVPSTRNFRSIYNVRESISLGEGLGLWAEWLSRQK